MKVTSLNIPDLLLIEPEIFEDSRGFFFESFNHKKFEKLIGREVNFVQDNHSGSKNGVLRGLHFQTDKPQGKLVRVTAGEIFDVAVDIRANSPTFGQWCGQILSSVNRRQYWIPEGFAHGFLVLSDEAEFLYKTTDYFAAELDNCIRWDDPTLAIIWPLKGKPVLSSKDQKGLLFSEMFNV